MDRSVIFTRAEAVRRLGGYVGGLETIIQPAECDGHDCLTDDQKRTVARLFRQAELPFDEASADNLARQATEMGILTAESDLSEQVI
jgi:hypothetical protein